MSQLKLLKQKEDHIEQNYEIARTRVKQEANRLREEVSEDEKDLLDKLEAAKKANMDELTERLEYIEERRAKLDKINADISEALRKDGSDDGPYLNKLISSINVQDIENREEEEKMSESFELYDVVFNEAETLNN